VLLNSGTAQKNTKLCLGRSLGSLCSDPNVRHAFEQRLTEYIDGIKQGAGLLLRRDYDVAFIGSKGIGKSTAICKVTGLEVPSPDNAPAMPVLEAGGGGVTICDVHLATGQGFGLLIEPCSEDEIRAHAIDFAEHIKGTGAADNDSEEGGQGVAQEVERAIRNLAGLKVRRDAPTASGPAAMKRKNSRQRPAACVNSWSKCSRAWNSIAAIAATSGTRPAQARRHSHGSRTRSSM
jgi:hypothetical protein